ncbi:uncharacterized [Tachysurus ichikawai]
MLGLKDNHGTVRIFSRTGPQNGQKVTPIGRRAGMGTLASGKELLYSTTLSNQQGEEESLESLETPPLFGVGDKAGFTVKTQTHGWQMRTLPTYHTTFSAIRFSILLGLKGGLCFYNYKMKEGALTLLQSEV